LKFAIQRIALTRAPVLRSLFPLELPWGEEGSGLARDSFKKI